eukprot:507882_1
MTQSPNLDDENDVLSGIEMNGLTLPEGGDTTQTTNYSRQGYTHVSQGQGSMQYPHPQPRTKTYHTVIYQVSHHLALIFCLICVCYLIFFKTNAVCVCDPFSTETTANHTTFKSTLEPTLSPLISSEMHTNSPSTQPSVGYFVHENHVGDYKVSSQNSNHSNWLLCDGSFLHSKDYPKLFAVIGYSFGSFTDYPSLFALPDASDRVVGIRGNSNPMGYDTGSESISLETSNIPAHSHYLMNSGYCTGGYANSRPFLTVICNVATGLLPNENFEYQHRATANPPNQFSSASVGSGSAFSIMQPTVFVGNLFIWAD